MKLKEAFLKMLDNNRGIGLVMLNLNVSPTTARDYIKKNHERLTLPKMSKAISAFFETPAEEIFEDDAADEGRTKLIPN